MIKRIILALAFLITPVIVFPATVLAVDPFDKSVCDNTTFSEKPTVCEEKDSTQPSTPGGEAENPLFGKEGILTKVINLLSIVAGIAAIIIIILAGLRFVTSGSNPQDIANARERIIYASVGLVIAALAQVLVRFIIGKIG